MKIRDLYVGDALQWQSGKAYKRGSNIRYGVVLSISEDKKRAMIANVFISDGKLNGGVGHHDGFRVCVVEELGDRNAVGRDADIPFPVLEPVTVVAGERWDRQGEQHDEGQREGDEFVGAFGHGGIILS